MKRTLCLFTATALWLSIGCALQPASSARPPSIVPYAVPQKRVIIENPAGMALLLSRVDRNGRTEVTSFDAVGPTSLDLPVGRYVLTARNQRAEIAYPIPLVDAVAQDSVTVTVHAPPDARPGLRYVPGGWSLQGDALGVGHEDERPCHLRWVESFWMGALEVSNEEYAAFLNEVRADNVEDWIALESRTVGIRRTDGGFVATAPEFPVTNVSFFGAEAYCRHRSDRTGEVWRLPSEAEWERAARGPESRTYSYGDVCTQTAANQESGALLRRGAFAENGYGIKDLTGNAFEWTGDTYDEHAYRHHVAGESPPEVSESDYRVLRGGSFVLDGVYLRNAFRMRYRPSVMADDVGFRVLVETKGTR